MAEPDMPLEEQKKVVLPFMQRAQEVEKADPKVAYYCRMYAIDQAMSIPRRAKEINSLLGIALSRLEKDKATLMVDKEQDKVHCEAFALRVFANADKVDRMGKADVGTSKGFYAASCFIELLNQFSPLDADMQGKQKYALWRAAEIRKALREGRQPLPPSGDDPLQPTAGADLDSGSTLSMAGIRTLDGAGPSSFTAGQGSSSSMARPSTGLSTASAPPSYPPPEPPGFYAPTSPASQQQQPATPPWSQGASGYLPGQRYKPGSPVLFCESAGIGSGSQEEKGTIGHVSMEPDGQFRYRVALRDRLVQATDMQVAPCPAEGAPVTYTPRQGAPPVLAHVILVNDGMGWPPSYIVSLPDGSDSSAQAHQLSMLMPEEATSAPPPLPPAPSWGADHQHLSPHLSAGSTQSNGPPGLGLDGPSQSSPSWSMPSPHAPGSPLAPATSMGRQPAAGPRSSSYQQPGPPPPAPAAPVYSQPAPAYGSAPTTAYGGPPPPQAPGWITIPTLPPGHKPSVPAILEAQKACRTAVSSLNFEDASAAVKYLTHALQVLTAPPGSQVAHLK